MSTVVVPFRAAGKTRLPAELRVELAAAMLADVLEAAVAVGDVRVVTDDFAVVPSGVVALADPGGGQGAAVAHALRDVTGTVLVVNADLPCVTASALHALAARTPAHVAATDGTTNAIALPDAAAFAPLYGVGSAARFARLGLAHVPIPELAYDVDTLDDLEAIDRRQLALGPRTACVLHRHRPTAAAR